MGKKGRVHNLGFLVRVSRPLLWVGLLLPFVTGLVLSRASLGLLPIIQLLLLGFPANLFLYGINDIHDYKSDIKNRRKGGLEGTKLCSEEFRSVKKWGLIGALLLAISSILTLNILNMVGTFLLLTTAYAYSTPPLRLKTRPPLDSLSNGLIYALGPGLMGSSFGSVLMPLKALGVAVGIAGAHALTTIADFTPDKKANDTTFAVKYGKRGAAGFAILLFISLFLFGYKSKLINFFIVWMLIVALILLILPKERLAEVLCKLSAAIALITAIVYLV